MEQRHGIPERTNIEDGPGKTRRFILGSTILWCLVFAAFYYIETVVLQQELEFSSQFLFIVFLLFYNLLYILAYCLPILILFAGLLKVTTIIFHKSFPKDNATKCTGPPDEE